jgi:hypothetical protein
MTGDGPSPENPTGKAEIVARRPPPGRLMINVPEPRCRPLRQLVVLNADYCPGRGGQHRCRSVAAWPELSPVVGAVLARLERPTSNLRIQAEVFAVGALTCLGFPAVWTLYWWVGCVRSPKTRSRTASAPAGRKARLAPQTSSHST